VALFVAALQAAPIFAQETSASPAAAVAPAWLPEAKPDQGLVVIFRERRFYGSANSIKVYADEGVALPKVKNGKFVYHYLAPGDHRLYADKRKQRDARIVGIEAGKVYFFEARFEAKSTIGADVDLVPVEYDEGLRRIGALGEAAKS
jgi:hypothetical protein